MKNFFKKNVFEQAKNLETSLVNKPPSMEQAIESAKKAASISSNIFSNAMRNTGFAKNFKLANLNNFQNNTPTSTFS